MTEPRTTVYRGATRSDVERAYHAGARAAVDDGYVPAGEEWSTALGQEALTVRYIYDPDQGTAVLSALDAAERESRLVAMAPGVAPPPPAAAPVSPPAQGAKPAKSTPTRVKVLLLLVLGLGAYAASQSGILTGGGLPSIGGVSTNVPPSGQIWFGTSFSPDTFAMTGRTTTAKVGGTVAAVATLPRAVSSGEINMRITLDGTILGVQNITMAGSGSGELVGVTLGPYFIGGEYDYAILDLGGNVLATGRLTVTQ
jgi:hypothetical protein